jgi:hypothetical protein
VVVLFGMLPGLPKNMISSDLLFQIRRSGPLYFDLRRFRQIGAWMYFLAKELNWQLA